KLVVHVERHHYCDGLRHQPLGHLHHRQALAPRDALHAALQALSTHGNRLAASSFLGVLTSTTFASAEGGSSPSSLIRGNHSAGIVSAWGIWSPLQCTSPP